MITALSIKKRATGEIINRFFQKGFSIITGETGAGKSIILGITKVLGKRADLSSLKNNEKCIIKLILKFLKYNLAAFRG
jgi:DNA repair protein RecN (Recombination protein N)